MTDILVQQDGPIATVVFNRPAMRNAISLAMWMEIARVTEGLGKDESVRAIVHRGAGTVAFASGADISEFKEQRKDTDSALHYNAQTAAAYTTIRECPKPTVAMVFGFCMGGAMAVAMACDLRFAAEGAKFGIPAARLGIIYGADSVGQLVDLVGPAYAKDILYSARTVEDREGLARGLRDLGHAVAIRSLSARTGFHTFDRWLYNACAALIPPAADVTVGVDLDGFLWARRRRRGPFVVMLKGIIADELRNERGWVRVLLSVRARRERTNTARPDLVGGPGPHS